MERQKKYEKPKNRKRTILRLGRYMIQYKYLVLLALGLTIGSNLFALIGPMLSGFAIDAIEPGICRVDFARVFYYAGLMAVYETAVHFHH